MYTLRISGQDVVGEEKEDERGVVREWKGRVHTYIGQYMQRGIEQEIVSKLRVVEVSGVIEGSVITQKKQNEMRGGKENQKV